VSLDRVLDQLRSYGLLVDDLEVGRLVRVDVEGHRRCSRNGWYSLFWYDRPDGTQVPAGNYGNWDTGDVQKVWLKGMGLSKTEKDIVNQRCADNKRIALQMRSEAARRAARTAEAMWRKAKVAGTSDYLTLRGIRPYGVRFGSNGAVIVPMRNQHDTLVGLQFLYDEGSGETLRDGYRPAGVARHGAMHIIGRIVRGKPIGLCVDYASGAAIHEATHLPMVVVFEADNLLTVIQSLRAVNSTSPLLLCGAADKDRKHGSWELFAKLAMEQACHLVRPLFRGKQPAELATFADMLKVGVLDDVHDAFAVVFEDLADWKHQLGRSRQGGLKGDTRNVYLVLGNDPAWRDVLSHCSFSDRTLKTRQPPFPQSAHAALNNEWSDDDTNRTDVWLAQHYDIPAPPSVINAAVDMVARDNARHPVREYLEQVASAWDGRMRLDAWLSDYLGVSPSEYVRLVGAKWLVGAVARVMELGAKNDTVLILEGPQGIGKSTALKVLGGEWYSDTQFPLGEKDGFEQLKGVWIYELAELDSFNKAEATRAKSFFASQVDRYRKAYGRRPESHARQNVFAGTTNQDAYLTDPTGNRRYWPVYCHAINLAALERDRDQLWAEAYLRYQTGAVWHVLPAEGHLFEAEQEQRFVTDSWETRVEQWLDDAGQVMSDAFTMGEIFEGALGMEPAQQRKPEQMRLASILTRMGWTRTKVRTGKTRTLKYRRPSKLQAQQVASQAPETRYEH